MTMRIRMALAKDAYPAKSHFTTHELTARLLEHR